MLEIEQYLNLEGYIVELGRDNVTNGLCTLHFFPMGYIYFKNIQCGICIFSLCVILVLRVNLLTPVDATYRISIN